jgi:hypothetical protein
MIMGPKTQLNNPHAVSVDPIHGEYFVPGREEDWRVLVFDRDAQGDVEPMRILEVDAEPGRVGVDPVRNLIVVSGDNRLRIYDRTATGKATPRGVITIPDSMGDAGTGLMRINPENGMIYVGVGIGGRHEARDFVGVWSVYDNGVVPPRYTIGGPGTILKDVRGVAIDLKNKNVIVTDKTLNSILTFHVPEAF